MFHSRVVVSSIYTHGYSYIYFALRFTMEQLNCIFLVSTI